MRAVLAETFPPQIPTFTDASWTFFFYTVAMNMMYALLSDTVSRLPVSTLNIGNMSHKQDLREFLDFVSIFGTNMDSVCKFL